MIESYVKKMIVRNWLFAISFASIMFVATYLIALFGAYFSEVDSIRHLSLRRFGGDITKELGFFEVLKSFGFEYFQFAITYFIRVFIPYLISAALFFDFINEPHTGWKRIILSTQILVPFLAVVILLSSQDIFYEKVIASIIVLGVSEVAVLIMTKVFFWIKKGFAAPAQ